jgi:transcriptional regulator with XRE-family HTH domain
MPTPSKRRPLSRSALGDLLRTLRTRRGLSQEAVADLVGMDRSYLGRVENGKARATFEIVERLLIALDATWHDFAQAVDSR